MERQSLQQRELLWFLSPWFCTCLGIIKVETRGSWLVDDIAGAAEESKHAKFGRGMDVDLLGQWLRKRNQM